MGDSGALVLGFTLATVSVAGLLKTASTVVLFLPLLVLAVPIIDTSFVVAKRLKYGGSRSRSPTGRTSTTASCDIGFTQRRAALTMWAWTASLGAAALATRFIPFREGGHWHLWRDHRGRRDRARGARVLGLHRLPARDRQAREPARAPPSRPGLRRGAAERVTVLRGGTVTFVFTDIEGSTELLKRLGDGYADALAEHRRLIRDAFGERGGQEIDTQGDAFFYCFERARDAVAAAVAAQRALAEHEWPDGTALRVRMSLHTGEPVVGEEGYVGIDVHRAARICSAGHGGQVLLSATTAALVSGALPDGVSKRDLGEVRLKDMEEAEHVTQLVIDGLPESFPPLRVEQEEPMDFGDRLARKIHADVERHLERSMSGFGPGAVEDAGKAGTRLRVLRPREPRAARRRDRRDHPADQARRLTRRRGEATRAAWTRGRRSRGARR